jgi:hypothetical protein
MEREILEAVNPVLSRVLGSSFFQILIPLFKSNAARGTQRTASLADSSIGRGFKPSSAKVAEGSKCIMRFVSRTP